MTDLSYPLRELTKIAPGHYRVSCAEVYATINRDLGGRQWRVEIHSQTDGHLIRFGGIWPSLHKARDEAEFILRWEA